MKALRYSVQEHADGWAVWELCPEVYDGGGCRFELLCSCLRADGGPLRSIVQVVRSCLRDALSICDVYEAGQGGFRDLAEGGQSRDGLCDGHVVEYAFHRVGPGEVPF